MRDGRDRAQLLRTAYDDGVGTAGSRRRRITTTRSMASRKRSSTDAPAVSAFSYAKRTRSGFDLAKRSAASMTTPPGWLLMRPIVGGGGDKRLSPPIGKRRE